jgi:hypothetical protein
MYRYFSSLIFTAFFSIALIDVVKTRTGDCSDLNLIKMNSCAVASQSSMEPNSYCAEKFGFNVRARDMPVLDLTNQSELQFQYDYEMCLCNGLTAVSKVIFEL